MPDVVKKKAHMWAQFAVVEVMAWLFSKVMRKTSLTELHSIFDNAFEALLHQVGKVLGHCDWELTIPRDTVEHALCRIVAGEPTMAEIRFNPTTMIPEARKCLLKTVSSSGKTFDVASISKRCRPLSSHVKELYAAWSSNQKSTRLQVRSGNRRTSLSSKMIASNDGTAGRKTSKHIWMSHRRADIEPKSCTGDLEAWVSKCNDPFPVLRQKPDGSDCASDAEKYRDDSDEGDKWCNSFDADPCDCDNEQNHLPKDSDTELDAKIDELLETLFEEVLRWRVDIRFTKTANLLDGNADWLDYWYKIHEQFLQHDPCETGNPTVYAKLWMAFTVIELRGAVIDAIEQKVPKLKENPAEFYKSLFGLGRSNSCDMIRFIVRKVGHSRRLTNMKTDSTDVTLNRKIVDEFSGMSLCMGYLSKRGSEKVHSPLTLLFCRSLHLEGEDIDRVGLEGRVDRVEMRLCVNRTLFSKFSVDTEDVLHVLPLCNIASITRMYKAVNRVHTLPTRLQQAFYRDYVIQDIRIVSDSDVTEVSDNMLRFGIDRGVYEFLKSHMKNGGSTDPRQLSGFVGSWRARKRPSREVAA